jgi:acyl-ACP thioesterase
MFEFESRVRYSEAVHTGKMNPVSIANYFQDCTTFHSASIGKDIEYYKKIQRGWFLNSWQIDIARFPSCGEQIFVKTWAYGFKGLYGYRNFLLRDEKKEICACANSVWFFTDIVSGQPVRVPYEEGTCYGSEEKFPMEYCSRKIAMPPDMEQGEPYTVSCHDIDTNGHVNNVRYIELAYEQLEELQNSEKIWRVRAEYKRAAVKGDLVVPSVGKAVFEGSKESPVKDGWEYFISLEGEKAAFASVAFYVK